MTMMPRMGSRFSVPSSWYPVPLNVWPFTTVCAEPWGFSLAAWFHDCCCVPGVSRMNLVKLRSITGRSVISRVSNVVATSARSVLRSWPCVAVTSTASDICPTSSFTSTLVWVSTFTFTEEIAVGLKPLSSAFTE